MPNNEELERRLIQQEQELNIQQESIKELQEQLRLTDLNKFPFSTFVIDNLKRTLGYTGQTLLSYGEALNDTTLSVNGDKDAIYKLVIRAKHTSAFSLQLQFNGDTGTNYKVLKHDYGRASGSDINQVANINNDTKIDLSAFSYKEWFGEVIIDAKSGHVRTINAKMSGFTDNNNETGSNVTAFWNNTSSNLTSIKIITGAITEGKYYLYRYA